MTRTSRVLYALSFIIAAAGFLLPLWPLCVVGILIAALSGRWIFAFVLGLLIDVAWGVPVGILHFLYFPFTLLALVGALIYYFSKNYFLDRTPTDTL
jgi:cell shape-determining protein MreD